MNRVITITAGQFHKLRAHLLRGVNADEEAAFLITGNSRTDSELNLLVREVIPVPDEFLLSKGAAGLEIDPDFISPIVKRCRIEAYSLVLTHSHPFSNEQVDFSGIDDSGEERLFPKVQKRCPSSNVAAMVFGQDSVEARIWETGTSFATAIDYVKVIGRSARKIFLRKKNFQNSYSRIHGRQILALTEEGQSLIREAKVGIVGTGGNGSQVLQQIVHLGVQRVAVVDFDKLEESNHARVVGSVFDDISNGTLKNDIMKRLGKQINPGIEIECFNGSIYQASVALKLRDCDVIFCCTDNMLSRMVLTRLGQQYLIPIIDTGIDIQPGKDGSVHRIGGRVMIVYPDGPCLDCLGFIDHEMLQKELDSYVGYTPNGYITGSKHQAASVIPFNGVIASLAVAEFLNLITGYLSNVRERSFQVYDGIKGIVRRVSLTPQRKCGVCDEVRAAGDKFFLPCKLDE